MGGQGKKWEKEVRTDYFLILLKKFSRKQKIRTQMAYNGSNCLPPGRLRDFARPCIEVYFNASSTSPQGSTSRGNRAPGRRNAARIA
jgi:hypothetical protein